MSAAERTFPAGTDPVWTNADNAALLTDLYQLTMAQAYFKEGHTEEAVFDLFFRRLGKRNYLIACGLESALDYLEKLHFAPEAIDYLRTLGLFQDDFLQELARLRFTGEVRAIPEGTAVFENEPIMQIAAPIMEAQLVESFLLNQITFQTGVASKVARVAHVAGGRSLAEFGMRRMHGADAALKGARAAFIGGMDSTSDVLAGFAFGIPVSGTMAHSYVQVHEVEELALRSFDSLYPGTTLLVDTYDTLAAVRKIVAMHRRDPEGFQVGGIRLDSGDLAALAAEARGVLDEGGLQNVKIFASGSLDEFAIRDLVRQGAPIDAFGVGTRVGTMADQPYLDSVYKLVSYDARGRMKLSAHKANLPCRKQVFRTVENGKIVGDVVSMDDEPGEGLPLLEVVMRGGKRTAAGRETMADAAKRARRSMETLPPHLLDLDLARTPYPVTVSDALQEATETLRAHLERASREPD